MWAMVFIQFRTYEERLSKILSIKTKMAKMVTVEITGNNDGKSVA